MFNKKTELIQEHSSRFRISGMHCTSCALSIDLTLEKVEGIKSSYTDYRKQECEVKYDPKKITMTELIAKIHTTGYEAEVI